MKDAVSLVRQYDYSGKLVREIQLPGLGTATGFSGKKTDKTVYYSFANYITPGTIYALEPQSGKSDGLRKTKSRFQKRRLCF